MDTKADYYVYVYIDPRNFEEFYYGKGKGSRKTAHLEDDSDSEKATRIKAIKKAGQKPIIKVIAKDLTEHDAYLIEKTLIWKLGRTLTNVSSGHFADKFRPHHTFHQDLSGFDFKNGIYYVNVGNWHQDWKDCLRLGFIAAGQGRRYSDPLKTLEPGDIVAAFMPKRHYVGIGRVIEKAVRINDFRVKGKSLTQFALVKKANTFRSCDDDALTDYYLKIEWIKWVHDVKDGKWKRKSGLLSSRTLRVSLQNRPETIAFLEKEFQVNFKELQSAE